MPLAAFIAPLLPYVGFSSTGVLPASLAAAYQSAVYGGATPAMPGTFATLTSWGMTFL
ncbi:hypothetical protein M409DRAFT_27036 [Zasmidium cellare ATCC 36951]|uniref:Uncharacterized protein n=1 Tax=Zasmidium cellare ATCC 36951 TaxID=1080233 RepID=A0A6A6C5T3_ZASCE|nr:uncharacterized protein M409DRAFT_27036 [Zasmidium cellare ATCC 36951]KAF2162411.1 hypothetical protein M409DRAFT_27036 [Zasmidium cellare ATCC 36951]